MVNGLLVCTAFAFYPGAKAHDWRRKPGEPRHLQVLARFLQRRDLTGRAFLRCLPGHLALSGTRNRGRGMSIFERLVKLAEHLERGFLVHRLARTARNEPSEPFVLLDAAFGRLSESMETSDEPRPAAE